LGSKQSSKTHVADFEYAWDPNFPMKITAHISNEYPVIRYMSQQIFG